MTATTGVGGLIYGRALVDQRTGKKINFDELGGGNIPEDITDLIASKAPIESPSLAGTPTAPTAAQGTNSTQIANTAFVKAAITTLINGAPSTLDTLKEIAAAINNDPNFSTTINNALALKAPLASPALTGVPTAPTAAQGTNNTQIATTAYVRAAISALVGSSPEALDTLNELAAALGNDPNFATTMTNALALKAPLSSPALTGTPTAPTAAQSVNNTQIATTAFVKSAIAGMDADLTGVKSTAPMGADFNDVGMGKYAFPLLGQENSNAAAVSNHPIPGSTGNAAWGIVWAAPRSTYPAQIFMNYEGQMLSRIKANHGWSVWWQFAGKPLSEYPGTYLFSVTTAAVRYLQEVSGSTLTPQRAGTWVALGETTANGTTLFQRIR